VSNKEAMKDYNQKVITIERDWRKMDFWQYENGVAKSREGMEDAKKQLKAHLADLKEKQRLCMLFEFPEAIAESETRLDWLTASLDNMATLWDLAEESQTFFSEAKELLWTEVDAESLEDETKRFIKMTKQLDKDVRWCRAFTGLDQAIKSFLVTMPLIQALHHDSMRARHWQMLKDTTGNNSRHRRKIQKCFCKAFWT